MVQLVLQEVNLILNDNFLEDVKILDQIIELQNNDKLMSKA